MICNLISFVLMYIYDACVWIYKYVDISVLRMQKQDFVHAEFERIKKEK